MYRLLLLCCFLLLDTCQLHGQQVANWPQGTGPQARFFSQGQNVPRSWSVVREQNIRWRKQAFGNRPKYSGYMGETNLLYHHGRR